MARRRGRRVTDGPPYDSRVSRSLLPSLRFPLLWFPQLLPSLRFPLLRFPHVSACLLQAIAIASAAFCKAGCLPFG